MIIEIADELDAQLIVCGRRGLGAVAPPCGSHRLLGSDRKMLAARHSDRVRWAVLDLLLEPRAEPWLVGELVEAIGRPIAVAEALEALQSAGLIKRHGEAVYIALI